MTTIKHANTKTSRLLNKQTRKQLSTKTVKLKNIQTEKQKSRQTIKHQNNKIMMQPNAKTSFGVLVFRNDAAFTGRAVKIGKHYWVV